MRKRALAIAGGVLAGLGVFLAVQELEKGNQWVAAFGLFVALNILVMIGIRVAIRRRLRDRRQSATDSAIMGPGIQISGDVLLSRDITLLPPADGTTPAAVDGLAESRSRTAGPVRRVAGDRKRRRYRRPMPGSPRRPAPVAFHDAGEEAAGSSRVPGAAGQSDAATQAGGELSMHERDGRLRDLAVAYGETAVVQALRETSEALAVVARAGAEAS